ncbi:acyl-CoA synthetase (AMP-forming)/AMP-acid ligase II [Kitasatospora sp. GAS204A]|uniref:fatty acyl-AMP ligase n=1 Tax=unclassified Kitasatospora TaxID=2633591 RepID=UPI002475D2BB|nr:fatty acyl-AMP ligase [Kitasatospora sp. GAS204B]MDH6122332.1 acyl-CoA synthetase (AMP-forming)/AMP-acid ligase II [Kitasatospora sp. GAS204B]
MRDRSARGLAAPPPGGQWEWEPLPAVLTGHAARCPDRPALSFVDYSRDPDGTWRTLTFAEVDQRARALAAALESRFVRGARVALLCPQGLEYGLGFLACLYAGMIAVPLFPPEDSRRIAQLTAVLADADPVCLLTDSRHADSCQDLTHRPVEVWPVDEAEPHLAPHWSQYRADPAEPAYLQYTSGSTGHPRGAVITHQNLVASTRQVIDGCGLSSDTPVASWLPLFHDMGLSIGVLAPILAGAHLALMSPLAFAQRPLRWLRLLDAHRAHFSGAPNFAYDLCVRRIPETDRDGLDLSSVRVLTNGAEPVRTGTLHRFTEAFAAGGLAPDTLKPSYGLAEATVLVACNRIGQRWTELRLDTEALAAGQVRVLNDRQAPPRLTTVVGCGRPVGQDVRVADPETRVEQPPGTVGELWVRGPNTANGYWRQPQDCAKLFDQVLKTSDGFENGWLRTGDLGFLHDGELFVLGRIKDVIIINGANHTPGDIEDTVGRAIPEAVPGAVAAFAVPGDDGEGDRLVVLVELAAGPRHAQDIGLRRRVMAAVGEHHGVRPHDILALRRGSLPRTTSGKLRRGDCRDRYLTDRFAPAAPTDTRTTP